MKKILLGMFAMFACLSLCCGGILFAGSFEPVDNETQIQTEQEEQDAKAEPTATGYWWDYLDGNLEYQSSAYGTTFFIDTAEQLAFVADKVNRGDLYYSGYEYVLRSDIDLSAHFWIPIGFEFENYFRGGFSGDDHIISGLTISGDKAFYDAYLTHYGKVYYSTKAVAWGLFGNCAGNTFANVTLKNCSVNVESGDSSEIIWSEENNYLGSLIGYMDKGSVQNVKSFSDVSFKLNRDARFLSVGGVVGGYAGAYSDDHYTVHVAELSSCYHNGTVSLLSHTGYETSDDAYVGGIVGRAFCLIKKCQNEGTVSSFTCMSPWQKKASATGGICATVGSIWKYASAALISDCFNFAKVYGGDYVGGIVGSVGKAVDGKYSFKNLANYGRVSSGKYIAGIVGAFKNEGQFYNCELKVENCVNFAEMTANDITTGAAGGVVGLVSYVNEPLLIDLCFNYGTIEEGHDVSAADVGGIVARAAWSHYVVNRCINYGLMAAGKYRGGIVGFHSPQYQSMIANCINYGIVAQQGATASGAIVGDYGEFGVTNPLLKSSIINCYHRSDSELCGKGRPEVEVCEGLSMDPLAQIMLNFSGRTWSDNSTATSGIKYSSWSNDIVRRTSAVDTNAKPVTCTRLVYDWFAAARDDGFDRWWNNGYKYSIVPSFVLQRAKVGTAQYTTSTGSGELTSYVSFQQKDLKDSNAWKKVGEYVDVLKGGVTNTYRIVTTAPEEDIYLYSPLSLEGQFVMYYDGSKSETLMSEFAWSDAVAADFTIGEYFINGIRNYQRTFNMKFKLFEADKETCELYDISEMTLVPKLHLYSKEVSITRKLDSMDGSYDSSYLGEISSPENVNYGDDWTFTVTPARGYTLERVVDNKTGKNVWHNLKERILVGPMKVSGKNWSLGAKTIKISNFTFEQADVTLIFRYVIYDVHVYVSGPISTPDGDYDYVSEQHAGHGYVSRGEFNRSDTYYNVSSSYVDGSPIYSAGADVRNALGLNYYGYEYTIYNVSGHGQNGLLYDSENPLVYESRDDSCLSVGNGGWIDMFDIEQECIKSDTQSKVELHVEVNLVDYDLQLVSMNSTWDSKEYSQSAEQMVAFDIDGERITDIFSTNQIENPEFFLKKQNDQMFDYVGAKFKLEQVLADGTTKTTWSDFDHLDYTIFFADEDEGSSVPLDDFISQYIDFFTANYVPSVDENDNEEDVGALALYQTSITIYFFFDVKQYDLSGSVLVTGSTDFAPEDLSVNTKVATPSEKNGGTKNFAGDKIYYGAPVTLSVENLMQGYKFLGFYLNTFSTTTILSLDKTYTFTNSAAGGADLISGIKIVASFQPYAVVEGDFTGKIHEISSAADLVKLSTMSENGESFEGHTFVQMCDLDMSNVIFNPIGERTPFAGTYDGGNYRIINLKIAGADTLDNAALFAQTNGAAIKNITFYGGKVAGIKLVAPAVAYAENTSFENVNNHSTRALRRKMTYVTISGAAVEEDVTGTFAGLVAKAINCNFVGCSNRADISAISGAGLVGTGTGIVISESFVVVNLITERLERICGAAEGDFTLENCYFKTSDNASESNTHFFNATLKNGETLSGTGFAASVLDGEAGLDESIWMKINGHWTLRRFYWN